jgi:exosortase
LPSTSLEVAEACSGLRSLVSLTAVAALLAWATERSITRRAALVLAAVPLAIIMNAMRVTATAVVCETWGPRAASGSWHTFTGWITFVASVFLLVQVQRVAGPTGRILSSWHERACSTRLRRDSCAL